MGEYSLTVIIPNYNKEKYILKCIDSVMGQTYDISEIIIVDDCSTDQSPEVIRKIARENPKIHPVFLKQNQGVSHARNVGIAECRSEYITFLDSDDYYGNKDKLMNEMVMIKQDQVSNVLAYSKLAFCDESGENIWQPNMKRRSYLEGNVYHRLVSGNFEFSTITRDYCIKKSILVDVGGYNEKKCLYEDLELLIKLSRKCRFACTMEQGSVYRQNTNGLSNRTSKELDYALREVLNEGMTDLSQADQIIIVWMKCMKKVKTTYLVALFGAKKAVKKIIARVS